MLVFALVLAATPVGMRSAAAQSAGAQAAAARSARVVVHAPDALRDEVEEELAVELASRGFRVDRDRAPGADYVVEVESAAVRVLCAQTERTVRTPVAPASDGRTLALVAATLMLEAAAEARPPPPSPRVEEPEVGPPAPPTHPARLLAPPGAARATALVSPPTEPEESPAPARVRRDVGVFFGVGAGGTYAVEGPYEEVGGIVRALFGVRLIEELRLGLSYSVGGQTQETVVATTSDGPLMRLALEVTGTVPLGDVSLHAAFCAGGYASEHTFHHDDGFSGLLPLRDWNVGLSLGAYVAVSFRLGAGIDLWIRFDLHAVAPDAVEGTDPPVTLLAIRQDLVFGSLSSMIVFE